MKSQPLAVLLLLTACAGGTPPPEAPSTATPTPAAPAPTTARPAPTPAPTNPEVAPPPEPALPPDEATAEAPGAPTCPDDMALVRRAKGPYCIDRWEASLVTREGGPWPGNRNIDGRESSVRAVSRPGVAPQGYISGEQAQSVCRASGKRLCEVDEWVVACRGPNRTLYPYGDERKPNVCNDRFRVLDRHPIPRLFRKHAPPGTDPKEMWHPRWMDDSRIHEMSHTIVPTGSKKGCTNDYGTFDMVGNLHEWVADPDGTFFGGFFMDTFQNGHGCGYRTIGHPFDYHDYSTGFRCCADASGTPASPGQPPRNAATSSASSSSFQSNVMPIKLTANPLGMNALSLTQETWPFGSNGG